MSIIKTLAFLLVLLTPTVVGGGAWAADGGVKERPNHDEPSAKAPRATPRPKERPTDGAIKKILIKESIALYSGNCPCPYNTASNGSSCGGRSAWSRAGGAEPLCYPKDVTAEMVQQYRDSHTDETN